MPPGNTRNRSRVRRDPYSVIMTNEEENPLPPGEESPGKNAPRKRAAKKTAKKGAEKRGAREAGSLARADKGEASESHDDEVTFAPGIVVDEDKGSEDAPPKEVSKQSQKSEAGRSRDQNGNEDNRKQEHHRHNKGPQHNDRQKNGNHFKTVSYTHLTLPTKA